MPKALFFNVPGHGHVIPSLPLVAELVRRGHQIIYFVTEGYRQQVEAAGAEMRAYTGLHDDYFTSRGLSGSVPQKTANALITTTEAILPELLDIARAEDPDYILFDGMCPWGHLVARILKRPAVASLSLPPVIQPPPSALPSMLPHILPMVLRDFGMGLDANKRANALTKQYGVAPLGITGIMNNAGDLSLSHTSAAFQAYADTVPKHVRFIGWTPYENPTASFSFEAFEGKPLVYVSLGTLNNDEFGFFRTCIDAFAGRSEHVILTTGSRIAPEAFGPLSDNVTIYRWVPQFEVMKRAALFISHGGLNSVHDALYLGVPLLLVPQQAEQTLTAMRVAELGAGLLLQKKAVTAEAIRSAASRLLTDSRFKAAAQHIGATLRDAGGAPRGADAIEALLRQSGRAPA